VSETPASPATPAKPGHATAWLVGILVLGAALRLWTISKDIPYGIGPDEPDVLNRAVDMMKSGSLNPHGFFDYPTLYMYVQVVVSCLRFLVGAMGREWASLQEVSDANFYLWGRVTTAMFGTLTIFVVYRAARRWGELVAIIAAAAIAVQPLHTRESHYVLTDVPTTLLVSIALLLAIRAADHHRLRWFALAGLTAGLAAATKYTGGVALLMPIAVAVLSRTPRHVIGIRLAACIGAAATGFVIGAPYSLLDLPGFLNGFAALAQHYNKGRPAAEAAATYFKHLLNSFGLGLVGPMSVALSWCGLLVRWVGLCALIWGARRAVDRAASGAVLVFPAIYFWLIANESSLLYARYAIPLLPMLAICSGLGVLALRNRILLATRSRHVQHGAVCAVIGLAFLPQLVQAFNWDREHARVTTTELAYEWALGHIAPTDKVHLETPTLRLPENRFLAIGERKLIDHTLEDYRADGTVYLIAVSEEYDKYSAPPRFARQAAAYATIFRDTEEVIRFVPGEHNEHPGSEIRVLKIRR
jgi:4-amino-4-deoxy-L-arabinose transferase-like glycosyltransferase